MSDHRSNQLMRDALHHLRQQEALFATIDDRQEPCPFIVKLLSHSLTTFYQIRRLATISV